MWEPAFFKCNGSVICTNFRVADFQEHDVHSTIRAPLHILCMPEINATEQKYLQFSAHWVCRFVKLTTNIWWLKLGFLTCSWQDSKLLERIHAARAPKLCLIINCTIFCRPKKRIACGLLLRNLIAFTHKLMLMNKSNSDGHLSVSRLCFGWNF